MNLASEAEFWLLENLWKAMRGTPPPVPVVLAKEDSYLAHVDMGFVQIPWNFTVTGLCDVLEEHLEDVRDGLKTRRNGATKVPAVSSDRNTELYFLEGHEEDGELSSDDEVADNDVPKLAC